MDSTPRFGEEVANEAIDCTSELARSRDGAGTDSSSTRLAEVELLRRAALGNPEAVEILLDVHMTAIHGFVIASVEASAVDDIMQETVIEAIRSAGSFQGESALTTWLHVIAQRRIFRHYGKERRQRAVSERVNVETVDSEAIVDRRDQVVRALRKLSPIHREVIVMKYVNDLSVLKIAEAIGKSRVQVQSLLQRARFALREALGHEGL